MGYHNQGPAGAGCGVPGAVPPFGKLRGLPKYERSRGRQAFRWVQYLYYFIPETKHPHQPERVKKPADSVYAEGSSIEAISRLPGMKSGSAYSRVNKASLARNLTQIVGEQRQDLSRGRASPRVISFDEMWTCVGARYSKSAAMLSDSIALSCLRPRLI